MPFEIPAHACEPPVPRDSPFYQNVIDIAGHGYPEEQVLRGEIEQLIASSTQSIRIGRTSLRDADSYLILTIGIGIATNLITDLIKYLAKRLMDEHAARQAPVIYISPAYAPKRVFRLPEEAKEAQEHFRHHPSRYSADKVEE